MTDNIPGGLVEAAKEEYTCLGGVIEEGKGDVEIGTTRKWKEKVYMETRCKG